MSVIIFIVILLVLVLVHEFGHFFTAKKFGIRVDEFGFGFPPKLFGKKFGETEYSVNLLPIGGFVRIFGESPDEESMTGPDSNRSFINKPKWQQAIVLVAGLFMNFLLAWILFSFGFMSGLPTSVGSEPRGQTLSDVHLVIVDVLLKSPADLAGLKTGDKIMTISIPASSNSNDYIKNPTPDQIKNFIVSHASVTSTKNPIAIGYERGPDKEAVTFVVPTVIGASDHPSIGISMDEIGTAKLPFFQALWEGMKLTLTMIKATATGLFGLIWGGIRGKGSLSGVSGPVGMVSIVGQAYKFGFAYLLSFAALISVNLGIINLIPFPALDGGRLFFILIEKIKGSRINPKVANTINMVGFGILILLMVVITYHDIVKLF